MRGAALEVPSRPPLGLRLTARLPTGEEADLLKIKRSEPVIAIVATVHDASDAGLFAAEVVMPGSLHELEDVYSVAKLVTL
ncbi:hypothetical protein GCM10009780_45850 [Actinomadura alba]